MKTNQSSNMSSKKQMFYISYLVGGSASFVEKSCVSRYQSREEAQNELSQVRSMGYPAMIAIDGIGGFESFSSSVFQSIEAAANYYRECVKTYLPK